MNMKKILIMAIVTPKCLDTSVSANDVGYIWKKYYNNGQVKTETPLVNNIPHGIEKWYYETGELWYEKPCVDGKVHGIEKWYYETGELWYEWPWVNDKIHGIYKEYYESGQLKEESRYVLGELIGTNNYDENGNIIIKK